MAATLVGVTVLFAASAWRLSQGPVSLSFLTPLITEALNEWSAPYRISLDDTIIAWAGWRRPLDIRAVGVRALGTGDQVVASVPEISFSFSVRGLLGGLIVPTRLELIGPHVRVVRTREGTFALALGESGAVSDDLAARFLRGLREPQPGRGSLARLRSLNISSGRLVIDDRLSGTTWGASMLDIKLARQGEDIHAEFEAEVDVGGDNVGVQGGLDYRGVTGTTHLEVDFSGVQTELLARRIKALRKLAMVRATFQGRAIADFDSKGSLVTAEFNVTSGEGTLNFPALWPDGLPVKSVRLHGRLQQDPRLAIIDDIAIDLGGPMLTANAVVTWIGSDTAINADAALHNMPIAALDRFWPKHLAKSPRSWITRNMTAGTVQETRLKLSVRTGGANPDDLSVESLTGTMQFSGAEVHYMRPLPPAVDVNATAVFTTDKFLITLKSGNVLGLRADPGSINLTRLDTDSERASLELVLHGALSEVLKIVDHPELKYASGLGIDPRGAKGDTATRIVMTFPLYAGLKMDEVQYAAAANLRDVRLRNVAMGKDLTGGKLKLRLDRNGLEVSGTGKLGPAQMKFAWHDDFSAGAKYRRRYKLDGMLDDAARRAFGLDFAPFLTGPVEVDAALLETADGRGDVVVKLALKDAVLRLSPFGWSKPRGKDGIAWFSLALQNRRLSKIHNFDIQTKGFRVNGGMVPAAAGKPLRIDLRRFLLGATDISGTILQQANGAFDVRLRGPGFDAAPLIRFGEDLDEPEMTLPPIWLRAKFDRLWFNPGEPIENVSGTAINDGEDWRTIKFVGTLPKNHRVTFDLSTRKGVRSLAFTSSNAGAALRAFDLFDTIQGGKLRLTGTRDRRVRDSRWTGGLTITDFQLLRAPFLARALLLASLPGIVNLLSGKGVTFSRLDMPYELKSKVLVIKKARSVGPALGLTADGEIDFIRDRISLKGTIVPAYTISSVLGKIPILGYFLTGKEKTGVFAASYSLKGPAAKATVTVNPLTALAPGFLRDLVDLIVNPDKSAPEAETPASKE
jgi:hypothetical protein